MGNRRGAEPVNENCFRGISRRTYFPGGLGLRRVEGEGRIRFAGRWRGARKFPSRTALVFARMSSRAAD